jgi:hypothetical protein
VTAASRWSEASRPLRKRRRRSAQVGARPAGFIGIARRQPPGRLPSPLRPRDARLAAKPARAVLTTSELAVQLPLLAQTDHVARSATDGHRARVLSRSRTRDPRGRHPARHHKRASRAWAGVRFGHRITPVRSDLRNQYPGRMRASRPALALAALLRSGHQTAVAGKGVTEQRTTAGTALLPSLRSSRPRPGHPTLPFAPKSEREDWRQARPARAPASSPKEASAGSCLGKRIPLNASARSAGVPVLSRRESTRPRRPGRARRREPRLRRQSLGPGRMRGSRRAGQNPTDT